MAQSRSRIIARTFLAILLLMCDVQQVLWAAMNTERSSQGSSPQLTVVVRVDNVAAIPDGVLHAAESRAAETFYQINVRTTWVDMREIHNNLRASFTLVLVKHGEKLGPYAGAQDALGVAVPSTHRAWVFYDKIEAAKDLVPVVGLLLGDVMAHELGHLMLSSSDHSLAGIMSAQLPMRMRPTDTFNKQQAADIVNRLLQIQSNGDATK